MIKITHNTKLIAYGCSHTAGGETADHIVLGKTIEETAKSKEEYTKNFNTGFLEWYKKYISPESLGEKEWSYWFQNVEGDVPGENITRVQKIEQANTWVKFLSDEFNIEYVNRAKSGSGIERQAFALLRDLHNGLIQPDDLVIVCLPSIIRWSFWPKKYDSSSEEKFTSGDPETVIVAFWLSGASGMQDFFSSPSIKSEVAEVIMTDTQLIWNYITSLSVIKNIAANRKNTLYFFSDEKDIREGFAKNTSHEAIRDTYLQALNDSHTIDIKGLFNNLNHKEPGTSYGFGHPLPEYQLDYAKKLYHAITTREDFEDAR